MSYRLLYEHSALVIFLFKLMESGLLGLLIPTVNLSHGVCLQPNIIEPAPTQAPDMGALIALDPATKQRCAQSLHSKIFLVNTKNYTPLLAHKDIANV